LRDGVGELIDEALRERPALPVRRAIEELESALSKGDHQTGLL
jgi:hypothetical protein